MQSVLAFLFSIWTFQINPLWGGVTLVFIEVIRFSSQLRF